MPTANAAAPVFAAEPNRRADLLQVLHSEADLALADYRAAKEREDAEYRARIAGKRPLRVYRCASDRFGTSRTRAEVVTLLAWETYQAAWFRYVRASNWLVDGELRALEAA